MSFSSWLSSGPDERVMAVVMEGGVRLRVRVSALRWSLCRSEVSGVYVISGATNRSFTTKAVSGKND